MIENLSSVFKTKESILFLKKKEYDIYYSCKLKYPLFLLLYSLNAYNHFNKRIVFPNIQQKQDC